MQEYYITTFCYGSKYLPIQEKWIERINDKCKNAMIKIYDNINIPIPSYDYAWWDIIRLHNNLLLSMETQKPIVQIDMDIIIEKDIESIVHLDYDFIISTEIGGDTAYPTECSQKLGFGVCSGFYIIKPSGYGFLSNLLSFMKEKKYNSCSDQVNLMHYIVEHPHNIVEEQIWLDGIEYKNKIIHIDDIKICVLDFEMVIRDPIVSKGQFANHINIDNVGGTHLFLKYFDEPLEHLPLTCRCGKLGNTNICHHKELQDVSKK